MSRTKEAHWDEIEEQDEQYIALELDAYMDDLLTEDPYQWGYDLAAANPNRSDWEIVKHAAELRGTIAFGSILEISRGAKQQRLDEEATHV